MKRIASLWGILLIVAILFSCAPKAMPAALEEKPSKVAVAAEIEGWEMEWERVKKEGKKEGRVVMYTTWRPEARSAISGAFKSKHDIVIEFILGRGNDLAEKVLTERRAGLFYADIFIGGATTMMTILRPANVFSPMEEAFILPEVKDPKSWMDGKYPFLDRKGLVFHATAHDAGGDAIIYNSQAIKNDEIRSWRDLLKPKFKGKINMNDPTVAGRGQQLFSVASEFLGLDFWKELARQEVDLVRDQRLQVDQLAKGKLFVSIAALNEVYNEYINAGAPIAVVQNLTDDVRYLSTASSNIALISNPPHPAATKTFLNWFLTKEALTIFVQETDWQSTRLDVPTDMVSGFRIRKPGFKYFNAESEDFLQKKLVYQEKAKEIFSPFIK